MRNLCTDTSIARVPQVLHALKIAHRNVQPASFFLDSRHDSRARCKLGEPHLASADDDGTESTNHLYWAPEVFQAGRAHVLVQGEAEKADMWSLGLTIVEIFNCGKCAFPNGLPLESDLDVEATLNESFGLPAPPSDIDFFSGVNNAIGGEKDSFNASKEEEPMAMQIAAKMKALQYDVRNELSKCGKELASKVLRSDPASRSSAADIILHIKTTDEEMKVRQNVELEGPRDTDVLRIANGAELIEQKDRLIQELEKLWLPWTGDAWALAERYYYTFHELNSASPVFRAAPSSQMTALQSLSHLQHAESHDDSAQSKLRVQKNLFKAAIGEVQPWGLSARNLDVWFLSLDSLRTAAPLLDALHGLDGPDLLSRCTRVDHPPWVELMTSSDGQPLQSRPGIHSSHVQSLNHNLNKHGIAFFALLHQYGRKSNLMNKAWLQRVGEGTRGQVHLVMDRQLFSLNRISEKMRIVVKLVRASHKDKRAVALKELERLKNVAASSEFIADMINMAGIGESVGESEFLFIEMEYYSRGNIRQLFEPSASPSSINDEALRWKLFSQMCKGLEAIHKQSFTHGNLKPENGQSASVYLIAAYVCSLMHPSTRHCARSSANEAPRCTPQRPPGAPFSLNDQFLQWKISSSGGCNTAIARHNVR